MGPYLLKRVLYMIPTLLGVAVLIFLMLRVVPGDIVELKLRGDGGAPTAQTVAAERTRLGLDKPLVAQFGDWMVGLATFDLGKSMWTERPVVEEIGGRLGLTLQVAVMATLIAILIAIPLGTIAALHKDGWIDHAIRIFTIGGLAVPSFWLGMIIIIVLLFTLNWIPPIEYVPIWVDPLRNLSQLIWPALAVGYRFSAVLARMVRSSIIEVMKEDYIRTARAKGLPGRQVVLRHALANALIPITTVVGIIISLLLSGAVVTEALFSIPGIGQLLTQAVLNRDYPMVQGGLLLVTGFLVLINVTVDVLYAFLDPRVRYE